MDKFDLNIELDNHLKYYKSLIKGSDTIGLSIEEKVNSIIDKKEKEDKIDKDDFVFIDSENLKLSIIQTDIIKVVSRIKLLYQLSFGLNIELSLSDNDKKIVESIVYSGGDFVFHEVSDKLMFIDNDLENTITGNSYNKISKADLNVMYNELKKQFDFYNSKKGGLSDGKSKETVNG